jgi:hypothetical protein
MGFSAARAELPGRIRKTPNNKIMSILIFLTIMVNPPYSCCKWVMGE